METDWTATHVGTYPITWADMGDEWLYRFGVALAQVSADTTVTGWRFDGTTGAFVEINLAVAARPSESRVLIGRAKDSVMVLVAGPSEPDERLADMVATAAAIAAERLGDAGTEHEWTAVIGNPADGAFESGKQLTAPAGIGPMTVSPSEVTFTAPVPTPQSLFSWSVHQSMPILVAGRSRGYSWDAASLGAARDLKTLCGLLAVAWNCNLEVLEAAAPRDWGTRRVPPRPIWYTEPGATFQSGADEPARMPVTIPEWADQAWLRVSQRPQIRASLDAYLEGAAVSRQHPSLALVAYISSIEVIADLLYKRPRCKACGNSTGIARAFRATIREVLDENRARQLDTVYAARSKTVHAGHLHGGETLPGAFRLGLWSGTDRDDFRWSVLSSVRNAARLLLERSITTELPKRAALPDA